MIYLTLGGIGVIFESVLPQDDLDTSMDPVVPRLPYRLRCEVLEITPESKLMMAYSSCPHKRLKAMWQKKQQLQTSKISEYLGSWAEKVQLASKFLSTIRENILIDDSPVLGLDGVLYPS